MKHSFLNSAFLFQTMINMAFCWFILLGRAVQKLVFGDLRVSEQQQLRDKFWNFVFYKFIFVFGIINVQYIDEVLLWCSWFSLLGFLHLLSQLSKDRFEYVSCINSLSNKIRKKLSLFRFKYRNISFIRLRLHWVRTLRFGNLL